MNWKNLFIFMLVAIPSMIILTRLLAWYFERLKASKKDREYSPSLPEGAQKEVKPFLTYEEYLKDLTGDGSLEDFLARCHAGAVPKKPEPEKTPAHIARQKLAEIQKRMGRPSLSLPHQVTGECGRCGKIGVRSPDGSFPMCKCNSMSPW